MNRSGSPTAATRSDKPARTWIGWLAWIATEDHCEWANPHVAKLRTPLGVLLIGAVSALLCGLFVAPQGFVILGVIAAVIVFGLAWPMIAMRGIRCRLVFQARRGREAKASTAKLIVTNRWPWPVWGLSINDPLRAGESIALARVEGWSTSTFNCVLTPSRRGDYPDREVRIGTGFPFGLYQSSRQAGVPRRLLVWPRTFWLPPLGINASRPHWSGTVAENRAGNEGTRLGVREHRPGDTLRDVHWAKTARYERLIVSERESTTVEDATVLVPVDPTDLATDASVEALEWRIRIAASICESFAASHGRCDLWLGGKRLSAEATHGALERLLDEVARFDPLQATETPSGAVRNASGVVFSIDSHAETIVLRRAVAGGAASGLREGRPAWIEIDSFDDVPERVLRGWRLGTGRVSRAG